MRAWRGLRNFKGEAALSTWLYRIAVNVCLNRVSAKTPTTEPIESTDHFEDTRIEGAQHAMIREERAVAVRKAIAEPAEEAARDVDPARVSRHVASADRRRARQLGRRGEGQFLPRAGELEEDPRERAMTHLTPDELDRRRWKALLAPSVRRTSRRATTCQRAARRALSCVLSDAQAGRACPSRRRSSGSTSRSACARRSMPRTPPARSWPAWLRWQVLAAARRRGADRCSR